MRKTLVLAAAVAAIPAVAFTQVPGLNDLIGARGSSGELEMQRRGYVYAGGSQGDDRAYTNWWNPRTRTCVAIATMDGRYTSITPTPAPDCQGRATTLPAPPLMPRPVGSTQPVQSWSHEEVDLGLVCYGEGRKPVASNRWGYTWDYRKDRYVYGNRTELRPQEFDASVMIQLRDGGGRIKLPKRLIPPLNSRGQDGWWNLSDVLMNRNMIRASYRLNGLNRPNVSIDRSTGRISIRGAADYAFNGSCDVIGPEAHPRF